MPTQTADAIRQLRRAAAMRALYPDGHPIHASALASAREAVEGLLDGNERVDLVFAGGEISRDGQTLPDSDGAVSELAGRWWAQGICGLRIGREASEGELSLLLDMSAPSARDLDVNVLNERLRQLDARHLAIIEIDYERFVPRSRLPQELREELGASDLGRVLRELVATPPDPGQGLSDSQRRSLAVLLDHPQALADAMEMGVLTPEEGSNPVPGPPVASVDPAERMLPQQGVPVDLAGARLATTVQHLARLGGELEAGAPSVVSAKLAAAVRHLDPAVVAHAYRAVGEEARGEPDALAEVANCLTVPELVQIVRSKPGAVAAEPSAVYRRLLTRVSGGGERAGELAPALREALTEDGWSDHLYASTIGVVLEEIAGRHSEVEEFPDGAIPIALRRAPEEARRARREEIQPQLERAFGDRVWADRALVSLELLQAAATPHAQSVAAADLKLSIQQTPAALKQEVWAQVALDLADLVDPHGPATEDHKSVARTVIAETSDPALIDLLRDFYPRASPEDRRRTARVLTVCGGHGLAAVVRLLLEDRGLLAEDDVEPLVQALLDADEAGLGGGEELSHALISPDCWAAPKIVRLLIDRGGPVAEKRLVYAMEQGSSRLRWSIIYAIGHAAAQHLEVLETALSDPDDYTACAAAQHLGSSGDPRAGPVLLEHVRPFHAKDPRFPLRLAVVQALGELRFADATEALIEVLWTTTFLDRRSNDVLRLAAAEALVRIGTERALSMVADRIEAERSHKIRKLAMRVARVLRLSAERRVEIHVP